MKTYCSRLINLLNSNKRSLEVAKQGPVYDHGIHFNFIVKGISKKSPQQSDSRQVFRDTR